MINMPLIENRTTIFKRFLICFLAIAILTMTFPLFACTVVNKNIGGTWRQGTAKLIISDDETTWESSGTTAGHCCGTVTKTSDGVYEFEITSNGRAMSLELSTDGTQLIANLSWGNGFLGGIWERS